MRDWPGRAHAETLRVWPELAQVVRRVETQPELFLGALLIGSLSRGEGDTLSDIDLIAVTRLDGWQDAWDARRTLSNGALAIFDRFEDKPGVAGHSWLTPDLIKVECLVTRPGAIRLAGDAVIIAGVDGLIDRFERIAPFTRDEINDYAAGLREAEAISDVERAYDDLIVVLRREVLSRREVSSPQSP